MRPSNIPINLRTTTLLEQKFEKIATLYSYSKSFDKHEKQVRNLVKKNKGLIQYQQRLGIKKNKLLYLSIGVPPERFDDFISHLKKIGSIEFFKVIKKELTSNYSTLLAKKKALIKFQRSLSRLKNKGGKISEFMTLEQQISSIETQIQDLDVQIKQYKISNNFCTVNFSITNQRAKEIEGFSFLSKIWMALRWTVQVYVKIVLILFLSVFSLFIIYKLFEKLKWLPEYAKEYLNKGKN